MRRRDGLCRIESVHCRFCQTLEIDPRICSVSLLVNVDKIKVFQTLVFLFVLSWQPLPAAAGPRRSPLNPVHRAPEATG